VTGVSWRNLAPADSARIRCQGPHATAACDSQATQCQTMHWETNGQRGVSFFYHCDDCAAYQKTLAKVPA